MESADHLIRMANQITGFFEVYPKSEALDGIAKHIHNLWAPRMRNAMKDIIEAGGEGLNPLFIEAMRDYFKGPKSDGRGEAPRRVWPTGGATADDLLKVAMSAAPPTEACRARDAATARHDRAPSRDRACQSKRRNRGTV